jgi:ferritin
LKKFKKHGRIYLKGSLHKIKLREKIMNEKVRELLNQQINKEFYSAYLYLDFSNYFEDAGLDGFANWYKIQAQEERDHAMLFYQYLQNENQKVTLEAIDKPNKEISCHMDVLKAGLEHEEYVTSLINDIYAAAYEVRDFRTMQFLDWFVKEQGEEETNANDLITKMELFGSDPKSLYMLNQELGARIYSAPSLVL